MSAAEKEKRTPRVAFQGEPGAYSEEAAQTWFGDAVETVPCRGFREVARAVAAGEAEYGRASGREHPGRLGGARAGRFARDRPRGRGRGGTPDPTLPDGHARDHGGGAREGDVAPVALAQCLRFFADRPDIEAVAVHDTAGAARLVAESGDPAVGALASEAAARRHGLEVLARDLQDRPDNSTRFYVVAPPGRAGAVPALAHPKSLVVFETGDRPGALVEVLQVFARRGLNLSRLESRPGRLPWTYRFVAEVTADMRAGEAAAGLEEVRSRAMTVVVRGPFAAAAGIAPEDRGAADVPVPEMEPWQDRLERTRNAINDVDEALVRVLAERLRLARRAQALRKEGGMGGVDPGREAKVLRRAGEWPASRPSRGADPGRLLANRGALYAQAGPLTPVGASV